MTEEERRPASVVDHDEAEVVVTPKTAREREDAVPPFPPDLAVLPLRDTLVFPGTVVPLRVGREKSQRLIDEVLPKQKVIACIAQRSSAIEDPRPDDMNGVGTAVMVLKLLRTEGQERQLIVHGLSRIAVDEWLATDPHLRARVHQMHDVEKGGTETEALMLNVRRLAQRIFELTPAIPEEAGVVLTNLESGGSMTDFLAANLRLEHDFRQTLLEETDVRLRLRRLASELQRQVEVLELSLKIQDQVKANIDRSQREYFLQEQLKAIQKELGQSDERTQEVEQIREAIDQAGMSEPVRAEALRELSRLEKLPPVSPEYNVIRTYLDVMTDLPWAVSTEDHLDVAYARNVLDEDHYDLEKVKRRILEYLAVRKLAPQSRGPILCFLGPPGVGKTSLGQSIARALGRKFIRMSLGGMRDEAELRGHRRTYIGAMPGRVIQEIRKAGTNNPVFMLDEIDKVGQDFRGDPTSALLEILDPAQNFAFQDNYLHVPFDLTKVLFIATANYAGPIPPALRDRMEVIDLPGYTSEEKLHIATRYLVPRQRKENGLAPAQLKWSDKAVQRVIEHYTRESGVRELERQIGTISRGVAALIAEEKARSRSVTPPLIAEFLGPRKYQSEVADRTSIPGVATGLAYTPSGGEIIFIEATGFQGRGALTLTGQIGDVMRESALAAMSLLKTRSEKIGIKTEMLQRTDVHVHVPAGAVPKDGPSAGTAIFTALVSFFLRRPVRSDVAMTGEITLRGLVMPVGGIKEKVLAAKRAGIKTVILPERNEKDLVDVPDSARKQLEFVFARTIDDVLNAAISPARRAKAPKAAADKPAPPAPKAAAAGETPPEKAAGGKKTAPAKGKAANGKPAPPPKGKGQARGGKKAKAAAPRSPATGRGGAREGSRRAAAAEPRADKGGGAP